MNMTDFSELLFVSDESATGSSVECYDMKLGVRVMTYKGGGGTARGTLGLIGQDYVVTAEVSKPFLHVWQLNKEEQSKRITIPGRATSLAVTLDGVYCAVAVDNKIYIWNVSSGQLLNVVVYHHEAITKMVFWGCTYLITAGADGLVAVWRLVDIVSKQTGESVSSGTLRPLAPFYSSAHHSLPVTDFHLASTGSTARLFTVSADQTCQIYHLGSDSGRLLLTLTFDHILTSVAVDRLQRRLFLGTDTGKIISFRMEPRYGVNTHHVDSSSDGNNFIGHTGNVNALCLSQEDTVLASGSEDKKIILWNTKTGQQMNVYQVHGSVTCLLFHVMRSDFATNDTKPMTLLSNFERTVVSKPEEVEIRLMVVNESNGSDSEELDELTFLERKYERCSGSDTKKFKPNNEGINRKTETIDSDEESDDSDSSANVPSDANMYGRMFGEEHPTTPVNGGRAEDGNERMTTLENWNRRLRRANKRLYLFGLDQVLRGRLDMGNDIIG